MHCTACGQQNVSGANFCQKCGQSLAASPGAATPISSPPSAPRQQAIPSGNQDFAFSVQDLEGAHLSVCVHNRRRPDPAVWDACMTAIRKAFERKPNYRSLGLVFTDGGGPNAKQRAQLSDMINSFSGINHTGLVVTDNLMVRGIVKALLWMNPKTPLAVATPKAFVDTVSDHFGLKPQSLDLIWEETQRLAAKVPSATVVQTVARVGYPAANPRKAV